VLNKIAVKLFHKIFKFLFNSKTKSTLVVEKYNEICILFNPNYDVVIRDYYLYCLKLIINEIAGLNCRCNIILGKYTYQFNNAYPTITIDFQIEHTLVKPGGRGSEEAKSGVVPIPGSIEQSYLVRIGNYNYLNELDIIIDYSQPNIINVHKSGKYETFVKKLFHIAPLLYDVNKGLGPNPRDLEVITLFGNPDEPRRRLFLNNLVTHGIECININNIFHEVDHLYRRTKILINIRQTNHHDTLEELRILPALRCGTIVISENAPLKEATGYSRFILWGNLEELPYLVKDVLNNYDAYHRKIFAGKSFIRRMKYLEYRNVMTAKKIGRRIKSISLASPSNTQNVNQIQ
jgi:hypothetical protein